MKYKAKRKKHARRRALKLKEVLDSPEPFQRPYVEKVVGWCPLYNRWCQFPQHTPHLSCYNCGGRLAISNKAKKQ